MHQYQCNLLMKLNNSESFYFYGRVVSNLISMSCQPHRLTSEQMLETRRKCTKLTTYIWMYMNDLAEKKKKTSDELHMSAATSKRQWMFLEFHACRSCGTAWMKGLVLLSSSLDDGNILLEINQLDIKDQCRAGWNSEQVKEKSKLLWS